MELNIVNYFYNISNSILDTVFQIFSFFGTDYFFFILFFIMYWTGSKRAAFKFACVYYLSVFTNFGLKNIIRRQRPYPLPYDTFAMPSGHAQGYALMATYNCMEDFRTKKYKTWQKWVFPILLVLIGVGVCISRMYFGRHYLSDVLVGSVIGIGCAFLFDFIVEFLAKKSPISLKKFMTAYLLPFSIVVYFMVTFIDVFNQDTVIKIYSSIGMYLGVYVGYLLDDRYLKYQASGTPFEKTKKMLLGALIMLTTYFILVKFIKIIYLLPLIFIAMGVMGTYVVPLVLTKVFEPSVKVGDK